MKRGVGEYAIEMVIRQIELEEILLPAREGHADPSERLRPADPRPRLGGAAAAGR